jgi:alcohol dehydrogenase class IV
MGARTTRLAGARDACCCHVPEAAKPQRPELWEGRAPREECREHAFEFDAARTRFGRGVLSEAGTTARAMGLRRVAVVTDRVVASQPFYDAAMRGLREAGVDAVEYAGARVEPTDQSFLEAARWAQDVRPDGFVSIGGGSCIDTAKAANLFSTHPPPEGIDDFLYYVNAPVGRAAQPPGPLRPHIACPTTAGTGSEGTGYAICDVAHLGVKTALAGRHLKPSLALVDPLTTHALPRSVVAAAGLDVVLHAAESFTARPHSQRPLGPAGAERPVT